MKIDNDANAMSSPLGSIGNGRRQQKLREFPKLRRQVWLKVMWEVYSKNLLISIRINFFY